jgi:hypothetical protein
LLSSQIIILVGTLLLHIIYSLFSDIKWEQVWYMLYLYRQDLYEILYMYVIYIIWNTVYDILFMKYCIIIYCHYMKQGRQNQLSILPRLSHSLYRQVKIFKNLLCKYIVSYWQVKNASHKNGQIIQNQIKPALWNTLYDILYMYMK